MPPGRYMSEKIDKLKSLLATVKPDRVGDLHKRIQFLETELEKKYEFEEVAKKLSKAPIKPIVCKRRAASESTVVAVISDWHSDEIVQSSTVNGINEYNRAIFERRVASLLSGTISLTNIQRNGTDINTLVLPLLGDFISGHIHEELAETTDLAPPVAAVEVFKVLVPFITELSKHFKRVVIPCCVGNHGRTTLKNRIATGIEHSYETIIYHFLASHFKVSGINNVEFQIGDGYHNYLNIYEYPMRFHHGHFIKYGGGIGGIAIPTLKAISQWNKIRTAYMDVFGHLHQFVAMRSFICNGSLIGFSPYALSIKAEPEPPCQVFFLMENKRGRTITCPIITP